MSSDNEHYLKRARIDFAATRQPWLTHFTALHWDQRCYNHAALIVEICTVIEQWHTLHLSHGREKKKTLKKILTVQKQFLPIRLMTISSRKRIISFALVLCEKHYKLKILPMLLTLLNSEIKKYSNLPMRKMKIPARSFEILLFIIFCRAHALSISLHYG